MRITLFIATLVLIACLPGCGMEGHEVDPPPPCGGIAFDCAPDEIFNLPEFFVATLLDADSNGLKETP